MDHQYPRIHLRPDSHWINDPNGMIYYKGSYHIFTQYNPNASIWGDIHWYHFSSSDLINWVEHPIALSPDQEYDASGCWSGVCIITDDGKPVIIYSADDGRKRLPALAWGDQSMITWVKDHRNPVIDQSPEYELNGFRDHAVFKHFDGSWLQLIGAGKNDTAIIYVYKSNNLIEWKYLGKWYQLYNPVEHMIECPDYVKNIGDSGKDLLIYSTNDTSHEQTLRSYWSLGGYELDEITHNRAAYHSQRTGIIDQSCMYAPQTLEDDQRVILVGWIREELENKELENRNWAGMLSIPRTLTVYQGEIIMKPVEEYQNLRNEVKYHEINKETKSLVISDLLREYIIKIKYPESKINLENPIFELNFESSNDANQTINLKLIGDMLYFTNSWKRSQPIESEISFKIDNSASENILLHIFIDGSVMEIFVNYIEVITTRFYSTNDIHHIKIQSESQCNIEEFELQPIIKTKGVDK